MKTRQWLLMDAATKMLDALMGETQEVAKVTLTREEKCSFLLKHIKNMNKEATADVCRIILICGFSRNLQETLEGLVVDLNGLPDHVIDQMYEVMNHKVSKITIC